MDVFRFEDDGQPEEIRRLKNRLQKIDDMILDSQFGGLDEVGLVLRPEREVVQGLLDPFTPPEPERTGDPLKQLGSL